MYAAGLMDDSRDCGEDRWGITGMTMQRIRKMGTWIHSPSKLKIDAIQAEDIEQGRANVSPTCISPASSQIEFWVDGVPRPQGSKKFIGAGRMVESSRHLKPWRDLVSAVAFQSMSGDPISTPVGVAVHFYFKAKSLPHRQNAHLLRTGAPDRPTTRSVETPTSCAAQFWIPWQSLWRRCTRR